MLVQSHAGVLHLLPAVPSAWPTGKVTGLKARGGFEVDLEWAQGKLTRAVVRSKVGGNVRLRTNDPVKIEGVTAKPASGANPNSFYRIVDAGKPIVASGVKLAEVKVSPTQTVDFVTTAGANYAISPR